METKKNDDSTYVVPIDLNRSAFNSGAHYTEESLAKAVSLFQQRINRGTLRGELGYPPASEASTINPDRACAQILDFMVGPDGKGEMLIKPAGPHAAECERLLSEQTPVHFGMRALCSMEFRSDGQGTAKIVRDIITFDLILDQP